MSLSDLLMTVGLAALELLTAGISLLAIYRALSLRRVLVDPLYRRRAFWTAVGALALIGFILATNVDALVSENYSIFANFVVGQVAEDLIWGLTFLGFFGWIYSSISVALSSDYFHRDALWWKKGAGTAIAVTIIGAYVLASIPSPPPTQQAVLAGYNFVSNFVGFLFALVSAYSAIVLVIIFRRTKDRAIRNYTKWVALSVFGLLLVAAIPSNVGYVALILGAYGAYRAAGALSIRTQELDKV